MQVTGLLEATLDTRDPVVACRTPFLKFRSRSGVMLRGFVFAKTERVVPFGLCIGEVPQSLA